MTNLLKLVCSSCDGDRPERSANVGSGGGQVGGPPISVAVAETVLAAASFADGVAMGVGGWITVGINVGVRVTEGGGTGTVVAVAVRSVEEASWQAKRTSVNKSRKNNLVLFIITHLN